MDDHKDQQEIDDFLLGRLTPEAEEGFRKKMLKDPELEQEVQLQQELLYGIEAFGQSRLRSKLKKIHGDVKSKKEAKGKIRSLPARWKWPGIAAGIILLAAAAIYICSSLVRKEKDLFAIYFQPYPAKIGFRDPVDSGRQKKLTLIRDLYLNNQYAQVIDQLEPLLDDPGIDSQLFLVLGSCYLKTDQNDKAIDTFVNLLEEEEALLRDQARWYLALAYLKQGRRNQAAALLEQLITDPKADHYEEAQQLLPQIN